MVSKSKCQYEDQYVPHDDSFFINYLDPDRKTIVISLPKPPPLELIDGWGESPENQYFKRMEVLKRILLLEEEVLTELNNIKRENRQETVTGYKIINNFWDRLEDRADDYEKEIEYIKRIWWHRINGYWFFNDGKPTYITGRHSMFLNFFTITGVKENNGKPEYRDRHRREYLFRDYLRVAHHTFAKRDEKGWAIAEDDGHYEMKDMGMPLFLGDIHPKSRRNGSSIMGLSDMIEGAELGFGRYSTIISKDGDSTEELYNMHLLPSWGVRPYFLKPLWNGTSSPTQIKYFPPKNAFTTDSLNSIIDYTPSAGIVKKDGSKLNGVIVFDEEGKTGTDTNVLERWDIYRNAMTLGDGTKIIGNCTHISTVEEINSSGKAFLDMLEQSDFYQRNDNGQTLSGLAAQVHPSYDGLEGFIDRWGQSVMNEPTDRQLTTYTKAQYAILGKGAYQYQKEKRDDYLKQGTPASMQSYRAYVKKYPWRSSELTIGTSGDLGFDYQIIDTRMAELRKLKSLGKLPIKIGNFHRDGNENPEGKVFWRTEENGRFELSMELPPEQTNLKRKSMGFDIEKNKYVPMFEPIYKSRFTAGADPFEYSNSKTDTGASKQSDGGLAVLWEHDTATDKLDNQMDWESRRFVLSYRYRPPSLQSYNEDCLMACEYFGAMLFLERNKTSTWEYFIKRGRGLYLKYEQDLQSGKLADKPGFYSQGASKDELFAEIKDYITFRGHKEVHLPFLEECRNIRAKDEMTRYDRLTAHGAALLGSRSPHGKAQDLRDTQKIELGKCSWLSY